MKFKIETSAIHDIDRAVVNAYSRYNGNNELEALSILFNEEISESIEAAVKNNLRNEPYFKQIFVANFCWIDKIPLAKFNPLVDDINSHPITEKVEIGDMYISFRRTQLNKNSFGKIFPNYQEDYGIIVQAKIAHNNPFSVPVGKIMPNKFNSTTKELKLLSDWPRFDLFQTSASKSPLNHGLAIDGLREKLAYFGGYIRSEKSITPWKFGFAKLGTPCDISFGELIANLLQKNIGGKIERGGSGNDWSKSCKQIERISGQYCLPSIYKGRHSSTRKITSKYLPCFLGIPMFWKTQRPKFLCLFMDLIETEGEFNNNDIPNNIPLSRD